MTNNAKNCDALRELSVLSLVVALLSPQELPEVQEHAIALLAFMLDKHTRNRSTFRDVKGGPAAVLAMYERVQGYGNKTEEYCLSCVESLGGLKKLQKDPEATTSINSGHSVETGDERFGNSSHNSSGRVPAIQMAPSLASSTKASPRGGRKDGQSPRPEKTKPVTGGSGIANSKSPRIIFGFGKKKEAEPSKASAHQWSQNVTGKEEDPVLLPGGGGRRSIGDEEDQ